MERDFLFYASAIVACVSLTGAFLNAHKKWYSFAIWASANIFWVIYDVAIEAYFQAVLFGCYLFMNLYGLYNWKFKEDKKKKKIRHHK